MGTRSGIRRMAVLVGLAVVASLSIQTVPQAGAAPRMTVRIAYGTDASWNALVRAGVVQAASEYQVKVVQSYSTDKKGRPVDPLAQLTEGSPGLVIGVGFMAEVSAAAASARPGTNFAFIDPDELASAANSQAILFANDEGSFLVGAAAALTSTSGQVGFIGGSDFSYFAPWLSGYSAGVQHANPGASIMVEYVGFQNPDGARESALAMYESGVDVIYAPAGPSMFGVLDAAREYSTMPGHTQVWMIGADVDVYQQVDASLQPYVLTSMVKRVDVVAYETVKAQATGTFAAGVQVYDLERDGLDYATSGGFVDELVPTLEGLRDGIIDDTITMP